MLEILVSDPRINAAVNSLLPLFLIISLPYIIAFILYLFEVDKAAISNLFLKMNEMNTVMKEDKKAISPEKASETITPATMDDKIKEVLKSEKLSWDKLSKALGGGDRSSLKVKVEGWANNLNKTFNQVGYEVIFKKVDNTQKK
ncbi:hypothetical protein EON73_02535 [bacterium]|nr:MAG: hypothetical protein EON73_02535 [bacterium]